MAQVWLDRDEVAALLNCPTDEAVSLITRNNWARRKSHDGVTRVKIPSDMIPLFIEQNRQPQVSPEPVSEDTMLAAVRTLREIARLASGDLTALPPAGITRRAGARS